MDSRICNTCGENKPLNLFRDNRKRCKKCNHELNKESAKRSSKYHYQKNKDKLKLFYEEHKEEIAARNRARYQKNKDDAKEKSRKYRENNKDKVKESVRKYYNNNRDSVLAYHKKYRENNKEKRAEQKRIYEKNRKNIDPAFRLRRSVKNAIYCAILRNGSKKNGSILQYLPYSMQELKKHIESMFEPWMNWDNWGTYNPKTWDDNDPATWTWQIDHITQQKVLIYDSMDHPNFKLCWSLDNLRPYSAKANIKENNRT